MATDDPVQHIPESARVEADPTPGMLREQAIAADGLWAGLVRTEPGMVSGWHHHGDNESVIFIVSGTLRMESGPGGENVVEAHAGDFLFVPAGSIHREANPDAEQSQIVVMRAGQGPPTFNVIGPAGG